MLYLQYMFINKDEPNATHAYHLYLNHARLIDPIPQIPKSQPVPSPSQADISRSTINPPTSPLPIRGLERGVVTRHETLTSTWTGILRTIHTCRTSPSTAQIDIGNDTLVSEVRRDITIRAREIRQCFAPSTRVRRAVGAVHEVGRDVAATEEPDSDTGITQLHGIDTAAIGVQCRAVGRNWSTHATACVIIGTVEAIGCEDRACLSACDVLHGAVRGCVKCHLVARGGLVDGFNDVDFAICGPV